MALQIIAWMASGLYFSLYPIEVIRGEHLVRAPEPVDAAEFAELGSPRLAARALEEHFGADWQVDSIGVVDISGQAVWRVEGRANGVPFRRLVGGTGTQVYPSLSEDEAVRLARDRLVEPGEIASIDWLETTEPGDEFRGGSLPVWKISFAEPESLHLYLDPWTREVVATRTTRWRIFDFLWMLHILDFEARENFNHPVIVIAAALGLSVALSGVIYWGMTSATLRGKKR